MRVGNAASEQFQLDVYGEVLDALHQARLIGADARAPRRVGRSSSALLEFLESRWRQPDEGIWEVRGPRQHFTHSKVMAWVAFDRAVNERRGVRARRARSTRWRAIRDEIHAEVCDEGFDAERERVHAVLRIEAARRQPC